MNRLVFCRYCEREHECKMFEPTPTHTLGGYYCYEKQKMHWHPKPVDDPTKYKRPSNHTDLVKKYNPGYCEMCLRTETVIKNIKGQTLHAHHIMPYQYGGSSERNNIWILCTPCHAYVEHVRRYHNDLISVKIISESIIQSLKPEDA